MQQAHTIRTRIAKLRQDQEADDTELCHLDQLCLASGYSDYLDEFTARLSDSRSGFDGSTDERVYHRSLARAGFATAYRF
jgi:hypothetical protein